MIELSTAQIDTLARMSHAADGAYLEISPEKRRRFRNMRGAMRVRYAMQGGHTVVMDEHGELVDGEGPVERHIRTSP